MIQLLLYVSLSASIIDLVSTSAHSHLKMFYQVDETPTTPTKSTAKPPHIAPFDSSLSTVPQTPPVDPSKAKDTVIVRTSLPSPGLTAPPPPPPSAAAGSQSTPSSGGKKNGSSTSDEDAFEALTKRFAELKKR